MHRPKLVPQTEGDGQGEQGDVVHQRPLDGGLPQRQETRRLHPRPRNAIRSQGTEQCSHDVQGDPSQIGKGEWLLLVEICYIYKSNFNAAIKSQDERIYEIVK